MHPFPLTVVYLPLRSLCVGPLPRRHLHLDPVGGIAGDMFVAALLAAFPEHVEAVVAAARAVAGVPCACLSHRDEALTGSRFVVTEHHRGHDHRHVAWRDVRGRIEAAALSPGVRHHAVGIFSCLAAAEARVHGEDVDAVTFHEVGAADSIADIVAAAWLIDAVDSESWSVAPLPLGGGTVRTAHGDMPVPAPATALLLEGLDVVDDGIAGERVTPTGAAIIRYLQCEPRPRTTARLCRSGMGFGARTLPGRGNYLRVLVLESDAAMPDSTHRELLVVAFEVDDQTAEDLAIGLDKLRALPDVHDVTQMPAFGKKGRMMTHVQLLACPSAMADIVEACFRETSTIGLRTHIVEGRALERSQTRVVVDGVELRVKRVARPGGMTGKTEADDVAKQPGHAARQALRYRAETLLDGQDGV